MHWFLSSQLQDQLHQSIKCYFVFKHEECSARSFTSFSTKYFHGSADRNRNIAQNPLQWEWGFASFANGSCRNGICWGLPLRLAQFIEIHFLPHLQSFMWKRKFEKTFLKKSLIQPPNGVLSISKPPFLNGSYRNGVWRALWALPSMAFPCPTQCW